jgi:hypothetical protein
MPIVFGCFVVTTAAVLSSALLLADRSRLASALLRISVYALSAEVTVGGLALACHARTLVLTFAGIAVFSVGLRMFSIGKLLVRRFRIV